MGIHPAQISTERCRGDDWETRAQRAFNLCEAAGRVSITPTDTARYRERLTLLRRSHDRDRVEGDGRGKLTENYRVLG